jgi:hypothetical protein
MCCVCVTGPAFPDQANAFRRAVPLRVWLFVRYERNVRLILWDHRAAMTESDAACSQSTSGCQRKHMPCGMKAEDLNVSNV